jgi:hypothetical protein
MDQEENPVIGTAVLKISDLFDDKDSLVSNLLKHSKACSILT